MSLFNVENLIKEEVEYHHIPGDDGVYVKFSSHSNLYEKVPELKWLHYDSKNPKNSKVVKVGVKKMGIFKHIMTSGARNKLDDFRKNFALW